jgi:hypothetical protein
MESEPISRRREHHFGVKSAVLLFALVVVIVNGFGELVEKVRDFSRRTDAPNISPHPSADVFDMAGEFTSEFERCEYRYLVVCDDKESIVGARDLARASEHASSTSIITDVPQVAVVLAAFQMLPKLPDAAIHMLRDRWRRGPLEFWAGVLFVLVYVSLIVTTMARKWPWGLIVGSLVVLYGPYLTSALFWLLRYLEQAAGALGPLFVYTVLALGVPACILITLTHDIHSLGEFLVDLYESWTSRNTRPT